MKLAVMDLTDRMQGGAGPQGEDVTQDHGRPNVASQAFRQTLSDRVKYIHRARHRAYKDSQFLNRLKRMS